MKFENFNEVEKIIKEIKRLNLKIIDLKKPDVYVEVKGGVDSILYTDEEDESKWLDEITKKYISELIKGYSADVEYLHKRLAEL